MRHLLNQRRGWARQGCGRRRRG